jgi:transposase-like protein
MGKRSQLSIQEREEVVLRLLRKEEPVAALARRYQVSEQTLYRWRDELLAGGRQALGQKAGSQAQKGQKRIAKLEKEVAQRAQVIGELSLANGLLKKLQACPE